MASQIVFIRELVVTFLGNELSIGIILAAWMFCGGMGTLLFRHLAQKIERANLLFTLLQIFLSIFLPIGVLSIRLIRPALGISPGQILPFHMLAISSILVLMPLCGILGFLFTLSCRIYKAGDRASGISRIYAAEAVGAMLGGAIVSFVLLRISSSLEIMAMLGLANAAAAFLFAERPQKKAVRISAVLIALFLGSLWLFNGWRGLEISSFGKQWQGYEVLDTRNSAYANLTTLRRSGQISFFDNGIRLYTLPDDSASEEAAHFPLLEHKNPKDVLLIGGGPGVINEILKHPVTHIDYVELDPELVNTARTLLPGRYASTFDDPRVSVKTSDGRYFIKTTGSKYDCIIVSLGDPYTAQLNRFYTLGFFNEAKRRLKKGGLVGLALAGSDSYINPDLAKYLGSIYATLKKAFADVKVIPGNTVYFLASGSPGALTYDHALLMGRAVERKLSTRYVREYYLFSRMAPDKISYTEGSLDASRPRLNLDLDPSSYYYAIIYWSSQFRDSVTVKVLRKNSAGIVWTAFFAVAMAAFLFGLKNRKNFSGIALAGVFVMGFSQAAIQIVILFSFQAIYGCLYLKLGALFTFFMAGLAIGGWREARIDAPGSDPKKRFIYFQTGIALYAFLFPPIAAALSLTGSDYLYRLGMVILFPALSLIAGFQGGSLFALANRLYLDSGKSTGSGESAGLTYGIDLLGSCAGAVLTAAFMIPVLGLGQNCAMVGLINLLLVLLLAQNRHTV